MEYPVILQRDGNSDYQVVVPDIPECRTSGQTTKIALKNAVVAIEIHLDTLKQSGDPIPTARRIEDHQQNPVYNGGIWALVTIDVSKHLGKSKRINITVPERLLIQIDQFTASHGGNRSAFLAESALNFISHHRYYENIVDSRGREVKAE